jgi:choline dehydrogenase
MSESIGRRDLLGAIVKGTFAAAVGSALPGRADVSGAGDSFDYIVVGSGAGGGPVAANLVKAGFRVLMLEAGGMAPSRNYSVPAFHGASTEDPSMAWSFYVNHYNGAAQAAKDSKLVKGRGVLYPRAGTLGGCTAHNAMLTLYPDNRDFDSIVQQTGDQSWNSGAMRAFYQRIERERFESKGLAQASSRQEGTGGWLGTEQTSPAILLKDKKLLELVVAAARQEGLGRELFEKLINEHVNLHLDPNEWAYVQNKKDGLFNIPKATDGGHRNGTRELILSMMAKYPGKLVLRTDSLATQIIFAPGTTRAIGIEYRTGKHQYRADPGASAAAAASSVKGRAMATREVILSGGAFNSPQLLMLSGIGARAELERLKIPVKLDLPGVGKNLQDRYEVGVASRLRNPLSLIKDCTWGAAGDPCLAAYDKSPAGHVYGSNGVVIALIKRSKKDKPDPDLVLFGVPGYFTGYAPGWSKRALQKDTFTWLILKGHTRNTAGSVGLRSADPLDTPDISFRYFDEGNDASKDDLDSVLAGVKIARGINSHIEAKLAVKAEEVPGPAYKTDDQLRTFIKNEAWGHHASCTNKMGPRQDASAVVDSKFRVHGTQGLRVVDASVFPRIPGLFIVVPTYMIAEKASDDIVADARAGVTR